MPQSTGRLGASPSDPYLSRLPEVAIGQGWPLRHASSPLKEAHNADQEIIEDSFTFTLGGFGARLFLILLEDSSSNTHN